MQKSMTGFGKEQATVNERNITVEIRAVNSKQLDLNIRMPQIYRGAESQIRALASAKLIRGRIDIFVEVGNSENSDCAINKSLYKKYLFELQSMTSKPLSEEVLLPVIMKFHDVLQQQKESVGDNELGKIAEITEMALTQVDTFRSKEGEGLETALCSYAEAIGKRIPLIEEYDSERTTSIREKFLNQLSKLSKDVEPDNNRLEQELIYYIERLDITEEKIRLAQHCAYFLKTLKEEDGAGKKLSFIAQEMGREINTLGAKANHYEIQKIVVEMKDELEKIKEQLSNVL